MTAMRQIAALLPLCLIAGACTTSVDALSSNVHAAPETTTHAHHSTGDADSAVGVHGMALFGGREGLYASHLPLYRAPHDAQILLELQIVDPKLDAELRAELARSPALWTLVPERFDLRGLAPAAANPVRSFKADIVEGHFERGGRTRHSDVDVRVLAIPHHSRLSASPARVDRARYRVHGRDAEERFLVKQIDARPDIDVIARVRACPELTEGDVVQTPWSDAPEVARSALAAAVVARCPDARIEAIYVETGDLR